MAAWRVLCMLGVMPQALATTCPLVPNKHIQYMCAHLAYAPQAVGSLRGQGCCLPLTARRTKQQRQGGTAQQLLPLHIGSKGGCFSCNLPVPMPIYLGAKRVKVGDIGLGLA